MAHGERVAPFEALCETLSERGYDRPPAVVCNAHITALSDDEEGFREDVETLAEQLGHDPMYQLIETEFSERGYYCAC